MGAGGDRRLSKRDATAIGLFLLVGAVAFFVLTAFTGNKGQLMSGIVLLPAAVFLGSLKNDTMTRSARA